MKAAWFESFGPAAQTIILGEQPTPIAGPGEVLVKLKTTGVNPSDVKKRAGAFPNLLDNGLVIPHSDGAGVIEAVGEGVDTGRIGERVFVYQAQYARRHGSAADYVAIDATRAPVLPDPASYEVGACIGIPIMTAHRCVFADGPVEGLTLVIRHAADFESFSVEGETAESINQRRKYDCRFAVKRLGFVFQGQGNTVVLHIKIMGSQLLLAARFKHLLVCKNVACTGNNRKHKDHANQIGI